MIFIHTEHFVCSCHLLTKLCTLFSVVTPEAKRQHLNDKTMSDLEKIGLTYHLKLVRESNEIVALRMKESNQELELKNASLNEELQAKEGHLKALMLRFEAKRNQVDEDEKKVADLEMQLKETKRRMQSGITEIMEMQNEVETYYEVINELKGDIRDNIEEVNVANNEFIKAASAKYPYISTNLG